MRSRLKRPALWILLAAAACGPAEFAQTSDPPDGLFIVKGRQLALHCLPGSAPTLIIDAGLGDSSDDWDLIAEDLNPQHSVCTYDRAGYGDSDPGPIPRSPEVNARDLKDLLSVAGVEPPYVLLGHSLGGVNVQVFWELYPTDVAGMILLDPSPSALMVQQRFPDLWNSLIAQGEDLQARAARAVQDSSSEAARLLTMASEHSEMLGWGSSIAAPGSFGDLPLLVLAAGRPREQMGEDAVAFQQFWIDENRALAGRSTAGCVEVLDSIGHAMAYEAPALVVDLIRGFLGGH